MRVYPRFSVRTLAIFVTLACAYFACWGPTKRPAATRQSTNNWTSDDVNDTREQHVSPVQISLNTF